MGFIIRSITILFFSIAFSFSSKAQSCLVPFNFENKPIEKVLDKWSKWCKVNFIYDAQLIQHIDVTADHGFISLRKSLDILFDDTTIGWTVLESGSIEIKQRTEILDYLKVKENFENEPLINILQNWENEFDLEIEYAERNLRGINIYGRFDDIKLEDAFDKIALATGVIFDFKSGKTLSVFNPNSAIDVTDLNIRVKKNVDISGIIKDAETGETLPFATLVIAGSSIGSTSNLDGYFSVFGVPTDTSTIEVSYIGYLNKSIKLNPDLAKSSIEVKLQSGGIALDEISITAVKKDQVLKQSGISKISMTPEIASILPSYGEKDIFRSLQLLPGVSGANESSSGLFVRGGTPDQNLILLDEFTVYHVDHLYGFFSAFNSNAIKDVQLHKGGFESKFGGRLSSVVEMTGKDGNSESFNMGFSASLLSLNGFVETPFSDGKGSFILTGRRSFQSALYNNIFDSFTEEAEQTNAPITRFGTNQVQPNSYFYDLNAKLTFRFSEIDKVSFSIYNGEDDLDNSRITDESNFGGRFANFFGGDAPNFSFVNDNFDVSNWGNIGSSLKWSRQWNKRFFSNTVVSYSNYFSERDRTNKVEITQADTTIVNSSGSFESNDLKDFSIKINNEYKLSQLNQIDFGIQLTYNDIDYLYTQNDTISLIDRQNSGLTASAFLQDKITIGNRLILNAGLRANYYEITNQTYIEPRLSASFILNDAIKLKGAFGKYNQFATRVIREDVQQGSRDFWVLADDDLIKPSSSAHYVLGASYDLGDYLFDIEYFRKDYSGLSEYTTRFTSSGFGPNQSLDLEEQFFIGNGVSKGIEFLVQKKVGRFAGWIGYTLSEVQYDFPDFSSEPYFANQDQTHELKLVGTYKLNNFDFSTTFVYATGRPYTAPIGYYEVGLIDGTSEPYFQVSEKNVLRYPSYHRLDLSATYNFNIGTSKANLGLSVFNLYGRSNIWYKEYEVIESQLLETDISLLGFTPSLFFSWTLK